jgi:hypothetical protein
LTSFYRWVEYFDPTANYRLAPCCGDPSPLTALSVNSSSRSAAAQAEHDRCILGTNLMIVR